MAKKSFFPFRFPKRFVPMHQYVPAHGPSGESLNILLIENDRQYVDMIRELIAMREKELWRLTHVSTLADAFMTMKDAHFDVVVLDLFLPDINGLKTLENFVSFDAMMPVVVMTDLTDEQIGKEAIREGAQDYIVKGQFTSDYFIRVLQYAVERKKLDRIKDELTGYLNHEISNPLSTIKDSIGQICDGILGPVNAKQKQFLKISLASIRRLITITEDVLLSTKLELGNLPLKKQPVDFNEAVRQIVDEFRPSFKLNKIGLKLRLPRGALPINADKERIGQILTNLLSNALKHTVKGCVYVDVKRSGQGVICSVSDTGDGIAEENLPKLFRKFEQGFSGNGRNHKGTGLGLFICKTLVELHGGRIEAKSRLGVGTKFIVTLPSN